MFNFANQMNALLKRNVHSRLNIRPRLENEAKFMFIFYEIIM